MMFEYATRNRRRFPYMGMVTTEEIESMLNEMG